VDAPADARTASADAQASQRAQYLKEQGETLRAATEVVSTAARLRGEGNLSGAIERLRFALNLTPQDALAHYQLGLTLRDKQDDAGAAEEFDKAYQLEPRLPPPRGDG
jgi:Flp pilus assembly protein TadD